MSMAVQETYRTVQEVAELLGVTEGRIRQILTRDAKRAKTRIGKKFGFAWMLSDDDVEAIRGFIGKFREEDA